MEQNLNSMQVILFVLIFTLLAQESLASNDSSDYLPDWFLISSGDNTASKCTNSRGSILIDEKIAALSARAELANQVSTSLKSKADFIISENLNSDSDNVSEEKFEMVINSLSKTDLVGSVITQKGKGKTNGKDVFCVEATISAENLYKTLENTARRNNIQASPELLKMLKSTAYKMAQK